MASIFVISPSPGDKLDQNHPMVRRSYADKHKAISKQDRSYEDRFVASQIITDRGEIYRYFAVYDGHNSENKSKGPRTLPANHVVLYMVDHFHEHIASLLNDVTTDNTQQFVESVKKLFCDVDKYMYEEKCIGGCTCDILLISKDYLFVFHLGDSKVLVFNQEGEIYLDTENHHPMSPKEYSRITSTGGIVYDGRVQGQLAMSRAMGDFDLKKVEDMYCCHGCVSCIPTVHVLETNDENPLQFVLATDGLTDAFEDTNEIVRIVLSHENPEEILLYHTEGNNFNDDTTFIVGSV